MILASIDSTPRKLVAHIGDDLVDSFDEGLALFMPWMLLSPAVSLGAETRARLRELDFDSIFERHYCQSVAVARFIVENAKRR